MAELLQNLMMQAVDVCMAAIPREVPPLAALESCRLVSHRGEHDGLDVRENTLRAFRNARDAGVWGIECDIRWSADGAPVISHDDSAARVFGRELCVSATPRAALARELPDIPDLEETLAQFGQDMHLMLELKDFGPGRRADRRAALRTLLAPLQPGVDFHILALAPELFELVDFLPPTALLPVAITNTGQMSRLALERGCAGVAGHYLLLTPALQRRHREAGQGVGTGFPASANCLYREIRRGVDWIFSDRAGALQRELHRQIAALAST